jgi:hypothetical protein
MFLQLAHTTLNIFKISKLLTLECYRNTKSFPLDEKYAMVQQIRRAALSVHLNIAEGFSRKSSRERPADGGMKLQEDLLSKLTRQLILLLILSIAYLKAFMNWENPLYRHLSNYQD